VSQTSRIHTELKRCLREAGLTYADVARGIGLSEASVKRLFSSESLSLSRLERICEMAGLSLADLVERMESEREYLTRLTDEQERALVADPKLLLMTYLLLNGAAPFEICEEHRVSRSEAQKLLLELDRLKIIELRPFNRVKPLTASNFAWRTDGPVLRLFRQRVQNEFLDADFQGPDETFRFVSGSLSPATRAQLCRAIERLVREFEDAVRQDQALPRSERSGSSAVIAFRPWEFSVFADLRRRPPGHPATPARKPARRRRT
jgi:DNA-binding Xre family transcriptional regulator